MGRRGGGEAAVFWKMLRAGVCTGQHLGGHLLFTWSGAQLAGAPPREAGPRPPFHFLAGVRRRRGAAGHE